MTLHKVSMKHPHFPPGKVFGVEGMGQLENHGEPIEVDSEEYRLATGNDLDEVLAGSAILHSEGGSKSDASATTSSDDGEGGEK